MPAPRSPKLRFLQNQSDADFFDSLIKVDRDEYIPGPTAEKMHMSLARTKIVRGGVGSGKTRSVCEHINNVALQYPGSLHFIGRKDITSLSKTTQKEFLEKVVSPETVYTFNVNDNTLYYQNGSQVIFREAKEPDKVKSLELTTYMLDEADENPNDEIQRRLNERLRQKIKINGKTVTPPYTGFIVLNPVDENHWIYELAQLSGEIDLQDFRFDTYENEKNLPPGYIQEIKRSNPPWEVERLVHGHWGRSVKGRPVFHGFSDDSNVRSLKTLPFEPLLVGWDFGYNHPAVSFAQSDRRTGRYYQLREFVGRKQTLHDIVPIIEKTIHGLVSPGFPVLHFGDPHGADKKDTGLSSIEVLQHHYGIHVTSRREVIKTGIDEIQHKISTKYPLDMGNPDIKESLFLVDKSCKVTIGALSGGYYRDEKGKPVKDGYYDHLPDTIRYIIVNNMGKSLKMKNYVRKRKIRNRYTGY